MWSVEGCFPNCSLNRNLLSSLKDLPVKPDSLPPSPYRSDRSVSFISAALHRALHNFTQAKEAVWSQEAGEPMATGFGGSYKFTHVK